jgi:hypothetical protein
MDMDHTRDGKLMITLLVYIKLDIFTQYIT